MKYLIRFNESFLNDKRYIEDIFLDFCEDGKFIVDVQNESGYINQPTPNYIRISPSQRSLFNGEYFNFSDLKDELIHLSSYLDYRMVSLSVIFSTHVSGNRKSQKRIEIDLDESFFNLLENDLLDEWLIESEGVSNIINLIVFFNI